MFYLIICMFVFQYHLTALLLTGWNNVGSCYRVYNVFIYLFSSKISGWWEEELMNHLRSGHTCAVIPCFLNYIYAIIIYYLCVALCKLLFMNINVFKLKWLHVEWYFSQFMCYKSDYTFSLSHWPDVSPKHTQTDYTKDL